MEVVFILSNTPGARHKRTRRTPADKIGEVIYTARSGDCDIIRQIQCDLMIRKVGMRIAIGLLLGTAAGAVPEATCRHHGRYAGRNHNRAANPVDKSQP